jgi:hypothetical protein
MLADAQGSCYVRQHMRIHTQSFNSQACGEQVASEGSAQRQDQQIKSAMDVHAASVVLVKEVISCYEAGPTGF